VEKRRCSALNKRGRPCGVPPLKDSDPPLCNRHSLTPEQMHEWAKRANLLGGRGRPKQRYAPERAQRIHDDFAEIGPVPAPLTDEPIASTEDGYRDVSTQLLRAKLRTQGYL
jgi:hypothetical protein